MNEKEKPNQPLNAIDPAEIAHLVESDPEYLSGDYKSPTHQKYMSDKLRLLRGLLVKPGSVSEGYVRKRITVIEHLLVLGFRKLDH